MNDPVELFSVLALRFEDLHGLAVEAQCEGQPREMMQILSEQIFNELQLGVAVLHQIIAALDAQ